MGWAFCFFVAGLFSVILGVVHFFMPVLFDFKAAIPSTGASLKPFQLGFLRYDTQRSDVYGLAWVMNHAVSYTLVTIGMVDLMWRSWVPTGLFMPITLWMIGWWTLRAGAQFYLGRRPGDWWIASGFAVLALFHGIAGLCL